MNVEARPPAKVATLQHKMPIQMIVFLLKRSARKPNGTLEIANTSSSRVCMRTELRIGNVQIRAQQGNQRDEHLTRGKINKINQHQNDQQSNLVARE